MGKVIISLSKEKENELRDLAMNKYEGKKGSISKIVEEGIDLVQTHEQKTKAEKDFWEMVNNAKDLGIGKFTREEANER